MASLNLSFYQKNLDLESAEFTRIEHIDALVAIVYKVTLKSGKELILKICERKNDYLREVFFLSLFANILAVPKIEKSLPPGEGTHGAVLMEYLPGTLLKPSAMTQSLAYELGRSLALIHNNKAQQYGDPQLGDLHDHPSHYFSFTKHN